jgi:hypothetical protein
MTAMHKAEIKQLRGDARRLEAVAKHLRAQAKDLAREDRVNQQHPPRVKVGTTPDGLTQGMINKVFGEE